MFISGIYQSYLSLYQCLKILSHHPRTFTQAQDSYFHPSLILDLALGSWEADSCHSQAAGKIQQEAGMGAGELAARQMALPYEFCKKNGF